MNKGTVGQRKQKDKVTSIGKYRVRKSFSIGLLLIFIVLLYLLYVIFGYFTGKKTSVYEVQTGSIVRDDVYTGLIIRQEKVIASDGDGYVNFFLPDASKLRYGQNMYALSASPLADKSKEEASNTEQEENMQETDPQTDKIRLSVFSRIHSYNEAYDPQNYRSLSALSDELSGLLQGAGMSGNNTDLGNAISAGNEDIRICTAPEDGVLSSHVDGLEEISLDTFTPSQVQKKDYKDHQIENDTAVKQSDPVCKLVTGEDWSLVIPLDADLEQTLRDRKSVRIRILKDNTELIGYFSILSRAGEDFGVITFDNSMVRYVQERYLRIELVLGDRSGLKIPKSAVVEKPFYAVPTDYLTTGGNSASQGVIVQTKGSSSASGTFQKIRIFAENTQEGCVYVPAEDFAPSTVLIKPESSVTCTLDHTVQLPGVYNVNQGYAIFKWVNILSENQEYYIVAPDSAYGIVNYDHIAQNGRSVRENEIITQ